MGAQMMHMNTQATSQTDPAFADGIAIVAGGSGGIGAQICLSLARAGANVLLTYHSRRAEAEKVVDEIRAMGREADAIRLDLGDAEAVKAAVGQARQRFGRLHSLVYAAGAAYAVHLRTAAGGVGADHQHRCLWLLQLRPSLPPIPEG
jgi:NAD(P)-dependent dehydrogenase (short-subunit alcohol dehydrogenase family)